MVFLADAATHFSAIGPNDFGYGIAALAQRAGDHPGGAVKFVRSLHCAGGCFSRVVGQGESQLFQPLQHCDVLIITEEILDASGDNFAHVVNSLKFLRRSRGYLLDVSKVSRK